MEGRSQVTGVAYEWRGKLVFWTDRLRRTISAITSDGVFSKTLIEGDANFQPTSIVVNSDDGKTLQLFRNLQGFYNVFVVVGFIFWINAVEGSMTIQRSWTTGVRITTLVDDVYRPTSLAVDYRSQGRLYWCDYDSNTIESVLPDGSDRVVVAQLTDGSRPFHIDVFAE